MSFKTNNHLEAEAGGLPIGDQPGLQARPCLEKKKKKNCVSIYKSIRKAI